MAKSLLFGLNEKDMMAYINTFNVPGNIFQTFFPTKYNPTLDIKYLQNSLNIPVAADIVAFDSKYPTKKRRTVEKFEGSIPKIEVGLPLKESELLDYNTLMGRYYMGDSAAAEELIKMVYGDLEYCWGAVNARLDWMVGQILSTGKVTLTNANNNSVVTETAIDFLVPSTHKVGYTTQAWSVAQAAAAKPVTEIRAVQKAARQAGVQLNYIITNQDTFDIFVQITEVQKLCAPWMAEALTTWKEPDLAQVNKAFSAKGLPQMVILEKYVNLETSAGTQTSTNIWTDGIYTLVPDINCGNTLYTKLAEEYTGIPSDGTIRNRRAHVLLKKWSDQNPYVEHTTGSTIAIPAWATAQRSWMIDGDNATTFGH